MYSARQPVLRQSDQVEPAFEKSLDNITELPVVSDLGPAFLAERHVSLLNHR